MKAILFLLTLTCAFSCMKSREEYEEAISDVREAQEEEARDYNEERSRGSNDREGMGGDE